MSKIKMISFLGNPGKQYEKTRHNFGFIVADQSALFSGCSWNNKKSYSESQVSVKGEKILLQKPLTFMNKSGSAVQSMAHFYKIKPEELLLVSDNKELPFGNYIFTYGKSEKGHNGLRSVSQALGTRNYHVLHLGIGEARGNSTDHVLGRFSAVEEKKIPDLIIDISNELERFLDGQS